VARLPTDQPWFLIADESNQCGDGIPSSHLVAIDRAGRQTQLDQGITSSAERLGAPPLLATCAADGSAALLDPMSWTRTPLPLPPWVTVTQIILSPDQHSAILQLACWIGSRCDESRPSFVDNQIIDLVSGAISPAPYLPTSYSLYGASVSIAFLGWGDAGLYSFESRNKAGGTALRVIDPYDAQGSAHEIASNVGYALNSSLDLLAVAAIQSPPRSMTVFDLRRGSREEIDRAAWLSNPALAPDGSALAYFRSDQDQGGVPPQHVELIVFDLTHHTRAVLPVSLGMPFEISTYGLMSSATFWSRDSQRIIALSYDASGAAQASLLTRDGALIHTVPLPAGQFLGITDDDQIMLDLADIHHLSWLPLRPGATPHLPPITFGTWSSVAYMPPLAPPDLPPTPAATAPPPAVTQLPIPAAPTPLPATAVPVSELDRLPRNAELLADLPPTHHVLYRVDGTLYRLALDGGPALALCGNAADGCSPRAVTPDEQHIVVQMRDGFSLVPLTGSTGVHLAALPADSPILYPSISPDGRQMVYPIAGDPPAAWRGLVSPNSTWVAALSGVPVTSGTPVQITPQLGPDEKIGNFGISADSRQVIYAIETPDPNFPSGLGNVATRTVALYRVPISGGPPTLLAASMNERAPIMTWWLSDDGRYLLYELRDASALWSVEIAGDRPVQLSAPDSGMISAFWESPDHQSVIYQAQSGLFRVLIAGGSATSIAGSASAEAIISVQRTPDRAHLIVRAGGGLYRVELNQGTATRLKVSVPADTSQYSDLAVTDDHALYQTADAIVSVALNDGRLVRLTPPGAPPQFVQLSPDGRYVLYTIAQAAGTRSLMSVPIDGGTPVLLLSGTIDETWLETMSGGYAVCRAGHGLYATPLAGGPRLQLAAPAQKARARLLINAATRQVIFLAEREGTDPSDEIGLYLATIPNSPERSR
jgi:hypothetical protein